MDNIQSLIALMLSTGTCSVIVVKALDVWFSRGKLDVDSEAGIRRELVERCTALTERCDKLANDLDEWRTRYFALSQKNVELQAQVDTLEEGKVTMQSEIDKLRAEVADLRTGTGSMTRVSAGEVHAGKVHAAEINAETVKARHVEAEAVKTKDKNRPA